MIPLFKVQMPPTVDGPLLETLHSGMVGQGPKVDEFESKLAEWLGVPHVLTTNSGTSALHLALRLAGVGAGDDVVTTAMTCTATNMPILERGARIAWADIGPDLNIDPFSVRKAVTPATKAIMCVHWGGYPCDLEELNAIAERRGLCVIEDAAHAFGATYKNEQIGARSRFAAFSFQAIKSLTTIDGGALVCQRQEDYKRGKLLRWYGIDREGPRGDFRCEADIVEYGYKFHMNDVAATIGIEQLKLLPFVLARHLDNAAFYDLEFEARGIRHARPLEYAEDRLSSYWLYTLLVGNRDSFVAHMAENGIQVSQVHKRNDAHTCFAPFRRPLPGVDEYSARQVSIPVGWWVTNADREKIMNVIEDWDKDYYGP